MLSPSLGKTFAKTAGFVAVILSVLILTPGLFGVSPNYEASHTALASQSALVGWWKFDEGIGSTAHDSSGSRDNGTLVNNPTWQSDTSCARGKSCLTFDGASQYVTVPDSSALKGMSSLTVSAWFKRDLVNNNNQVIVAKGKLIGPDTSSYGIWIDTNNHVEFACDTGTCGDLVSPAAVTDTTHWHFAAGTYSNHDERLYLDGKLVAEYTTPTGNIYSTTDPLTIGARTHPTDPAFFGGSIDDVRVYNVALSPYDISKLYSLSSLVGWWKFDEGTGSIARDSSTNRDFGTLANNPIWVPSASCIEGKSCLAFNGLNQSVSVPDSSALKGMSSLTVSAWVKRSNIDGNLQVIVAKGMLDGVGTSSYGIWFYSDNRVLFAVDNGTAIMTVGLTKITDTTKWHLVTGTYTSGKMKLFVDGKVSQAFTAPKGHIFSTPDPLTVGARTHPTVPLYLSGSVDDVRIYDRVLTQSQIQSMYNTACSTHAGIC